MELTELCFAGVARQAHAVRSGEVTARDLIAEHLRRIERIDPRLNAFRLVFAEQALDEAERADERRSAGEDLPLLGVPIAVKEDIALAGLPTTKGTNAARTPQPADSAIVTRLRAAGAVIIGRTRMPELGLWPFTESSWAGPTRNPWSLTHSPGGSSGGSAAAVAAGLAAAAIGTDGAGSIRIPSAVTGLFGLKPQRGRVSLSPEPQVWGGLVVAGPITRTVLDWALVADEIHGAVPGDAHVAHPPRMSFTQAARTDPGRLRIGVSLRPWGPGIAIADEVRDVVQDTAALLTDLGHDVVRLDPPMRDVTASTQFAVRYLHNAYLARTGMEFPDLVEPRTRAAAELGRRLPRGAVRWAAKDDVALTAYANRVFASIDVLLTPALTRPPIRVGEWDGRNVVTALLAAAHYTTFLPLWNIVGNPAASVPAGRTSAGLPLAVQLVGRQHDECTLLSVSAQLERARPWADRIPSGLDHAN
ncbi:amidase [Lentzea albidocapillata subsp. violacea]|uniref:Amidase n=1 Tax=Lentzea albidocapillata subsp. violacea TaxID=128104 RepID=A0A1G8RP15_9PSEU|nr:amidase [Lentzea albidocapillata]SDJ18738.1 amidase [Lentzea albidocapillata subsp. violacea]